MLKNSEITERQIDELVSRAIRIQFEIPIVEIRNKRYFFYIDTDVGPVYVDVETGQQVLNPYGEPGEGGVKMKECEVCGVHVADMPFEELAMDMEEAYDTLFESYETSDGELFMCKGCAVLHRERPGREGR